MKPLEQFVRLLLYRSQYHFFDLKTVMRQYVQDDAGRAYLRTDDTTVPRSDRALASFHFLIEQKMRNHCFVGRDYANESLQNCIFSVFDDLYSLEPQQVSRFYPSEVDGALEPGQRPAADQLDLSQRQAIEKAIDELVDDLALGQAAEVFTSGQPGAMLTWRKDAPLRFRAVARLTDYEREAQLRVKRMVEVTALFESRGWLSGGLPPDLVTGAKEDLTAVVRSFDDSRVAPSREQVAKIVIDCEVQTAPLVDELTRRHLERLQSTAGQLTPIPGPDPAFLFMEGTPPQTPRGLLLYETFSSGTPGRSLEPPLQDGESLAVVIVTLDHQASQGIPAGKIRSRHRRDACGCAGELRPHRPGTRSSLSCGLGRSHGRRDPLRPDVARSPRGDVARLGGSVTGHPPEVDGVRPPSIERRHRGDEL